LALDHAGQGAGLIESAAPAPPPVHRQCSVTFTLKSLNNFSLYPTLYPTCFFRNWLGYMHSIGIVLGQHQFYCLATGKSAVF
jgi:hypothetical protein